jgi:hypothetical protein
MSSLVMLAVMCGILVAVVGGVGLVVFLLKAGVVAQEATRPPHLDQGSYTLSQGREVRPEEEQK